VPLRLTVRGLPVALLVIVIVPVCAPAVVGVNVTLIVQFAPATSEFPQVLVCAYCVLAVILVMLSATVPELVIETICDALVVFSNSVPKLRLVGERPMFAPVPVRAMVWGLPVALSLMVMVPVRDPTDKGVNFTVIVQRAAAASEAPQLFVSEKSPLGAMLMMLSTEVPVLLNLTVFDELVVLICWPLKIRLVGERLTVVGPEVVPVPVRMTVCGLPVALSVNVTVPD